MISPGYLPCDFHTHTTYCDGKNTPREMADAAYARGMCAIGIGVHSYTWFDESYCILPDKVDAFRRELTELKRLYHGKIEIFSGVEQDYWSTAPTDGFDYVIGSVHYVRAGERYYPIDHTPALFREAVTCGFGGDVYALIEEYYRTVGDLPSRMRLDLVGHLDVITKFNETSPLFDEAHPRYLAARQAALERLLAAGIPFEVNTGGMGRGYKTQPYPATDVLSAIRESGGVVLPTSDSHASSTLCYAFDSVAPALTERGFSLLSAQEAFLDCLRKRARL